MFLNVTVKSPHWGGGKVNLEVSGSQLLKVTVTDFELEHPVVVSVTVTVKV